MKKCSRYIVAVASLAAVVSGIQAAYAQQPIAALQAVDAASYYSQGVHAYFAGRSNYAEGYLTSAIALAPNDPRAYYFRALSLLRQGRRDEAIADMQVGASFEAQLPNRFAVGAALERVQGGDRLLLEQFRATARTAQASMRADINRQRYQQISHSEPEVLYRRGTVPLDQLARPNGSKPVVVFERLGRPQSASSLASVRPKSAAAGASASDDPFPDDPIQPAGAAPTGLVAPAASGSTAQPSTSTAPNDDPFGTLPATSTTPSAPSAPLAPTAPRPSTAVPPVEEDPFKSP